MKKILKYPFQKLYLALILLFLYAPIILMIVFSFNESRQLGSWTGFSLKWYKQLFAATDMLDALWCTLAVALLAAVISTLVGTVTAIGLQGYGKISKSVVTNITYLPVVNPDIITGLSLMILFIFANIKRGFLTMLISHVVFCIPYVIFAVLPKLRQVNFSKYEAAQDLGATPTQALIKVIVPEIMPGIVSGFMLSFTLSIDDFVVSYFTSGDGVQNLSTYIYTTIVKKGLNPTLNALSTIMFVTIFVLLVIINVYQSKGKKKRAANIANAKNEELAFEIQSTAKQQDFEYSKEERN